MFRSEWKKLKSPMMIVVILALILVPFLYNSIFLSAFWDPYGQTEDIKVAIVNEDKATKFKGEKVDIGDQFVDKLKKMMILIGSSYLRTKPKKNYVTAKSI